MIILDEYVEAIHDTGKSMNDGSGSIYSNVCINGGACLSATNFILTAELCMDKIITTTSKSVNYFILKYTSRNTWMRIAPPLTPLCTNRTQSKALTRQASNQTAIVVNESINESMSICLPHYKSNRAK